MIQSFKNRATEDIFNGKKSKVALKLCPVSLWKTAGRKLDQLDSVVSLEEMRIPPGNQLEALSGDRKGQFRAPLLIVVSDLKTRRTEHRNRSVHRVHEDFEHRPTKYSGRVTN